MSNGLSYGDAVRLLGGQDSKIVTALDKITGGVLLGAAPTIPAVLGWFEAKGEFIRLCQDLVRGFTERRSGLSRYGRTERLLAAHSVIVITAFFEAIEATDLPFRFAELELTKDEQVNLASDSGADLFVLRLLDVTEKVLPAPNRSYEELLAFLQGYYYASLTHEFNGFIQGLIVWDRLNDTDRDRFQYAMQRIPGVARSHYEELFRRLAADFPEVWCWVSLREHQATRAEVRGLGIALTKLEQILTEVSTGQAPTDLRAALTRAYRADLDRPVAASGDVPEGLHVPALREAYLPSLFRIRDLTPGEQASDESWWDQVAVRDDLEEFLAGHLTLPQAVRAPLLVLGQPGSGKSVLTRVLAARLPAPDFLPVRVVLREVQAAADIQEQLEQAIRNATGEHMGWPDLARSAGDALPVILLDGFDELLQATGVSQSDYLVKVAAFQRREADQGRPVAAIVTSRTSVAGRARPPLESVALRLEPFDAVRVTAWLQVWNSANAAYFARRNLLPLMPKTVLAHHELAGQPLLLLMLALYDIDANALQEVRAADLREGELYEQLLRRFAAREIMKHHPGIRDLDLDVAIEEELRRLSLVAFAMFNRGSQWVTETDLDMDLIAIFGARPSATPQDMRAPLGFAGASLGEFFFVHRSRALRDDTRLETYEFLHATFGEFLIARFTCQVISDIAAHDAVSTMPLVAATTTDDLLYALLSFSVLSVRPPILGFLAERLAQLSNANLESQVDLLKRLFRAVHDTHPIRRFDNYRPRSVQVTVRHAAYSANLMLIAVSASSSIRTSELLGSKRTAVVEWHRRALLWRSQLSSEEWTSLVEAISLDRLWDRSERDVRLSISNNRLPRPQSFDPNWTYDLGPEGGPGWDYQFSDPKELRRKAYFLCGINDDVAYHALAPVFDTRIEEGLTQFFIEELPGKIPYSPVSALLDALLLPMRKHTNEEREIIYRRCATLITRITPEMWDADAKWAYAALLLDRLSSDDAATPSLAVNILNIFNPRPYDSFSDEFAASFVRCSIAFLGQGRESDLHLAEGLCRILMPDLSTVPAIYSIEALVRLAELGLPIPSVQQLDHPDDILDLVRSTADRRPDLPARFQRVLMSLQNADEPPRTS